MSNCDPHLLAAKPLLAKTLTTMHGALHLTVLRAFSAIRAFSPIRAVGALKAVNTKKVLKRALGIAVFACLASCGGGNSNSGAGNEQAAAPQPAPMPAPEESAIRSFVSIGDSIGNGAGFVSMPWPELVQDAFGVPLVNDSVNGRQTGQGLSLIRGLLNQHDPSHVLILLGTNDATKGGSVSGAIANLQEMANIAESLGVTAVIGTTIATTRSAEFNQKAADIAAGIRGIRNAVIAESRVAFGNGSGLLADDVHPNAQGQRVIADEFINALR